MWPHKPLFVLLYGASLMRAIEAALLGTGGVLI